MLRIIAGTVVGFVVWSILWVGIDAVLRALSPSYDESAGTMSFSAAQLIIPLVLSAFCSIAAGFAAASIARDNTLAPLILGVVLLLVGIFVQLGVWDKIPLWYHLSFWILLIPMALAGGKLKKVKS